MLVPAKSREVDGEEWSDSRLDVGEEEIQPVQTAQGSPRRERFGPEAWQAIIGWRRGFGRRADVCGFH